MLDKLFTQLFEKLKNEEENDSIKPSGCFKFFVDKILEEKYNKIHIVSSKTITDYYNKFVLNRNNNAGEPKSELKNLIADYLGFLDYTDFKNSNKTVKTLSKNDSPSVNNKSVKELIIASASVFFILSFFIYNNNIEKCIIWKGTKFIKSPCYNKNSINNDTYNIDIDNFKKTEVNKKTPFFENGKPVIWYGKSKSKKMEFFTDRGIHPETLKELKPITELIINKYVFTDKEDKTILE